MATDDNEDSSSTTAIVTSAGRKKTIIPGVDNETLALAIAGLGLGISTINYITSEQGKELIQKIFTPPARNPIAQPNGQQSQLQIASPPPPPVPDIIPEQQNNGSAQDNPPPNESGETPRLNISPPAVTNSPELEEIDHKNFQTQRRPTKSSGPSPSPFGLGVASG